MKQTTKEKTKKGEIAMMILAGIGIAGIVVVALAAPNALQIIPGFQRKRYRKSSLDRSLAALLRRGFVEMRRGKYGWRVELTEKGMQELFLYESRQKLFQRRRWNRKWHVLIFDISEKRRLTRDAIRKTLLQFGFYRLQDSVWVFPYDCERILELLRTKYRVRHDALYMRVDKIANDQELRRHFGLPR
jgi:CRISPR-associated endonuclease Cas2